MKKFTWVIALLVAVLVSQLINNLGIALWLAECFGPEDPDAVALLAGLFSGILTVACYGLSFYYAHKLSKIRDKESFEEGLLRSGMSEFEYAKSIAPASVIAYCEKHLNEPTHIIVGSLDQFADGKIISRPCADALIKGYTNQINATKQSKG